MRQSLKIALSLLVAVVVCSGFSVLAFSGGLFASLQASFIRPRVEQEVGRVLDNAAAIVTEYDRANTERFSAVAASPAADAAFAMNPAESDLRQLSADIGALRGAVDALIGVRFLSPDGRLIWFSTLPSDEAERSAGRVVYKKLEEADPSIPAARLAAPAAPSVLIDAGDRQRIIYLLPVKENAGRLLGSAVFYLGSLDLAGRLFALGGMEAAGFSLASTESASAVLLGADPAESAAVLPALADPAARAAGSLLAVPSGQGEPPREVRLFAREVGPGRLVAIVEPESRFLLSDPIRWFLVAAFGLTAFLIVFLLFNLRADPLDVVAQRVKRFQVQLLEGMVEREGTGDWGRWRTELESRSGELNRQLLRGIGRVSRKQRPALDGLLAKSWAEILDLLARRAQAAPPPAPIDVSRLEALVQQALKSASFVVPAQIIGSPAPPSAPARPPVARQPAASLEVEELAAEEVEDLAGPEQGAEELEELEPVAEAVQRRPAASPYAETAAIEEAETAEAEAAGAVAETEEVTELEELEEVAEEEQPKPAPEAVLSRTTEPITAAPPGAAPEAEELGEVADLEELEPVGDFDATEEPARARMPPPQSSGASQPREPAAEAAPTVEIEELGEIEELEPVPELRPLPPLPEEPGLELLPAADVEIQSMPRVVLELPGALERLAASAASPGAVMLAGGPPAGPKETAVSGASNPESPRDRGGVGGELPPDEEVEELEAVEEVGEPGERPWTGADEREELTRLQAQGVISTWTMEQLAKIVEETKSAIVIENGVFRIKEEVYAAGNRAADGRLRQIAEDLIRGRGTEAAGVVGEGGLSGIGDLISDAESIDLANVVGADRTESEPVTLEGERPKVMRLKRGGLDYDEFLAAYPRSFSTTTQMKSLVEISRRVSAVSAALLAKGGEGWGPELAIGLAERSLAGLRIRPGDPLGDLLVAQRVAVTVNRSPAEIRTLRSRFDPEDLRFSRRLVFLPATFRGQDACLMLSFTSEGDTSLAAVFSGLQVQ